MDEPSASLDPSLAALHLSRVPLRYTQSRQPSELWDGSEILKLAFSMP